MTKPVSRWYAVKAGNIHTDDGWWLADDATADSEAVIVRGLTRQQAETIAEAHNRAHTSEDS